MTDQEGRKKGKDKGARLIPSVAAFVLQAVLPGIPLAGCDAECQASSTGRWWKSKGMRGTHGWTAHTLPHPVFLEDRKRLLSGTQMLLKGTAETSTTYLVQRLGHEPVQKLLAPLCY